MSKRRRRNDLTVKIAAAIHSKARMIALDRRIPLAEYLSALLEQPVERDYQAYRRRLLQEGGDPGAVPDPG